MRDELTYVVPDAPKLFETGDPVDVCDRTGVKIGEAIIARRGRQLMTNDGRMWTKAGLYWNGRAWPFPFIRHREPLAPETKGETT